MHSPDDRRWRLHHQASIIMGAGDDAVLTCVGRRWHLRGLRPELAQWLTALTSWPQLLPLPQSPQADRVAEWLVSEGLVTRSCLEQTTLVARGYSCLRGPLSARIPVQRSVLPQPDDLALHAGLVVVEGGEHDRTTTWLLRRAGVPHVVVELSAELARVGTFLAARGCTRCHDMKLISRRPLLAQHPEARTSRLSAPDWMTDWAANLVVLATRRWQSGQDLTPSWSWLDSQGQTGQQAVTPHRWCCAAAATAPQRVA